MGIVDDPDFEVEESFLLKLAHPKGTEACEARVGDLHTTTITITNYDDGKENTHLLQHVYILYSKISV